MFIAVFIMPKTATRSDSVPEGSMGVAKIDIDELVQTACQKAVDVLKVELLKMFSDINTRLDSVEKRLAVMEQRTADYESGLNDLSTRVMEIQGTTDGGVVDGVQDRLQEIMQELSTVKTEIKAAVCSANDAEQYGRRNNIRIRGLPLGEKDDCRSAVVSFLKEKLQVNVSGDDIEAAHILPTRSNENAKSTDQSTARAVPKQHPVIIVRFRSREARDGVLRKRRLLKNTPFAIVEDLTALNSKTLTRVSKDPAVAAAWSWNGKIIVLKKTGDKVTVKPFQFFY